MNLNLSNLFSLSVEELEEIYSKYKTPSRDTLWLMPSQTSDNCCVKGSDLILMFFQGSLILYCERVVIPHVKTKEKEILNAFNLQIANAPDGIHSKIIHYPDFLELQLYRKEYLEWLEINT